MEISSIWFAGATNLYSQEFYRLARSRLADGGVFQQWVQLHHIGKDEVASIITTVQSVFPHVALWVFGGQGIIVASDQPLRYSAAAQQRFLLARERLGLDQKAALALKKQLKRSLVLAPPDVKRFVASQSFTLNTDRNRYLEYATPRYNLSRLDHRAINMQLLGQFSSGSPIDTEEQTARRVPQ
jgi:spermidine synthase